MDYMKKYPKYGNKASKKLSKEVQKANSSVFAKKEIKRLKEEILKISNEDVLEINLNI
jgi:hypothetical protein